MFLTLLLYPGFCKAGTSSARHFTALTSNRMGNLSSPSKAHGVSNLTNSSPVLQSLRVLWMVVSAGPKSLCAFSVTFLPLLSPLSFLCAVDSFTLSRANAAHLSFFFHSSNPFLGYFVPDVSTIVPPPLMLPTCDCPDQGMPPSRASPYTDVFQGVNCRVADPLHGTPHAPCNHFIQKG